MLALAALGGVEDGPAGLVLEDPLAGELAGLDLLEDLLHLGAGLLVDDPRAAGVVAVLGRVRDAVAHVVEAALIHQVDDQLELVQALEVGALGLVAGLDQRLEAHLDQGADAAAEDDLLAEEVGLGLLGEGRLEDAAAGAADPLGVGQGQGLARRASSSSPVAIRQGTPPPLTNSLRTRWPGPLGATRALSTPVGGHDLAEVDVEPVRAEQQVAGPEVRLDVAGVDVALDLVGQEDVDQVAGLGGLGGRDRLEAVA